MVKWLFIPEDLIRTGYKVFADKYGKTYIYSSKKKKKMNKPFIFVSIQTPEGW